MSIDADLATWSTLLGVPTPSWRHGPWSMTRLIGEGTIELADSPIIRTHALHELSHFVRWYRLGRPVAGLDIPHGWAFFETLLEAFCEVGQPKWYAWDQEYGSLGQAAWTAKKYGWQAEKIKIAYQARLDREGGRNGG